MQECFPIMCPKGSQSHNVEIYPIPSFYIYQGEQSLTTEDNLRPLRKYYQRNVN
jgi:hypothetical protein